MIRASKCKLKKYLLENKTKESVTLDCKIKKLVNILFLRGKYVKIRKNTIRFEATASSSVVKGNCKLCA